MLYSPTDFRGRLVNPAYLVAVATLLVLISSPQAGVGMLALGLLARLAIQARRARVAFRQGGVAVDTLFGLTKRWVPFASVHELRVEGRELLARNDQGQVLFRVGDSRQSPWAETLAEIERERSSADATRTGFERGASSLSDWLADVTARTQGADGPAYRERPLDAERALEIFRSTARGADARAGAAWVLLGGSDLAHSRAVLDAASPFLPPLVLAVCALHPAGSTFVPLARAQLRYLSRADRREWKRLFAQRGSVARALTA